MKVCPVCNRILKERIIERRLCTKWIDDKKNYLVSCHGCFVHRNDVYREMWEEYKSSSGY